jgi:hypothetical protein
MAVTNQGSEKSGQCGSLGKPENAIECSSLQDVSK